MNISFVKCTLRIFRPWKSTTPFIFHQILVYLVDDCFRSNLSGTLLLCLLFESLERIRSRLILARNRPNRFVQAAAEDRQARKR